MNKLKPSKFKSYLRVWAAPISLLTILFFFGALGYRITEGWDWGDCLWMVLITITTIGFGEVEVSPDPNFGVLVPQACPDVPGEVLNPRNTWSDGSAYDSQARNLTQRFEGNFKQFEDHVDDSVKAAAIRAAA